LKLNSTAPYSRFFIYVWAYEQGEMSKRAMGVKATSSTTAEESRAEVVDSGVGGQGIGEEKIQDVLVPWVLKARPKSKPKSRSIPKSKRSIISPSTKSDQGGEGEAQDEQEVEVQEDQEEEEEEEKEKVFNRYYHLFLSGELRDLVYEAGKKEGYRILPSSSSHSSSSSIDPIAPAPHPSTSIPSSNKEDTGMDGDGKWLRIRGEGWEADNWWVEAEVGLGDGR
jgi:tRNA (uracil-5-)-methyltransferase TRM9